MPRSYTWGTAEGVQAVINELSGERPLELRLNADDAEALIRGLSFVADTLTCEDNPELVNPEEHGSDGECSPYCWVERARDLLGALAEVHGVDWV